MAKLKIRYVVEETFDFSLSMIPNAQELADTIKNPAAWSPARIDSPQTVKAHGGQGAIITPRPDEYKLNFEEAEIVD